MNENSQTCETCFQKVVENGKQCLDCLDYYWAATVAERALDGADITEKHLRAAIGAEIVREFFRRNR